MFLPMEYMVQPISAWINIHCNSFSTKSSYGSLCNILRYVILCIFCVISISCNNTSDSRYFNGEIVLFEDSLQLETLKGEQVVLDGLYTGRMDVCDSLVFMQSFLYPGYFIAVFNHYTGKHLGDFFQKGNGPNEHIDLSWIYQFFYEEGHLKGLLCSFYRKKIVIWDITESLDTGITYMSQIDLPEIDSKSALGGYMFFASNEYLVANINHFISPNIPNHIYYKIDRVTQELKQTYSFYKKLIDNNDNVFLMLYHHFPVAHNIKGTKLSSAMAILHQINILDIETGMLKGYRMNRSPNFGNIVGRQLEIEIHYTTITADTQYIYALYAGEATNLKSGFPNGRYIHIFDWNGKFLRKLYLDKEAGHIGIDARNHVLLIKDDYTDEVYRYYLNVEKSASN